MWSYKHKQKKIGIRVPTDAKLRLHKVTLRAMLIYGSDAWIGNRKEVEKSEVPEVRF